jgi:hypothetical protein
MQSRMMPKLMVRLPADVKEWLEAQAARNAASQASEIVRAVRERMERCGISQHPTREAAPRDVIGTRVE